MEKETGKKRLSGIDWLALIVLALLALWFAACGSIRGTVSAAITVHDSTNVYGTVTRNPDGTYTYRLSHEGCKLLGRYITKTDTLK